MPRQERHLFRTVFHAAIFILLEVAALHMLARGGELQQNYFAGISHGVQQYVWGKSESIKYYFSLREQNEALAAENMRLREAIGSACDLAAEEDLASVFQALPASGFAFIPARIAKLSRNKQHNYMIIDRGSEDGVRPQDGIVTSCGVVGIVEAVGDHYAYAISLQNKDLSISARIGLDGASGPMSWDGRSSHGAILREIPLQYRFSPGDTVYTSGHSSIFPAGIPLGVMGEAKIVNGATYEIKVTLFQDFSTLRYVSVARNEGRDAIRQLEQQVAEAAEGGDRS